MAAPELRTDQTEHSSRGIPEPPAFFPASHWRSLGEDGPPRRFLFVLPHIRGLCYACCALGISSMIWLFCSAVLLVVSVSEYLFKIVGPRFSHHAMDDCGDFFDAAGHAFFRSGLHKLSWHILERHQSNVSVESVCPKQPVDICILWIINFYVIPF